MFFCFPPVVRKAPWLSVPSQWFVRARATTGARVRSGAARLRARSARSPGRRGGELGRRITAIIESLSDVQRRVILLQKQPLSSVVYTPAAVTGPTLPAPVSLRAPFATIVRPSLAFSARFRRDTPRAGARAPQTHRSSSANRGLARSLVRRASSCPAKIHPRSDSLIYNRQSSVDNFVVDRSIA